MIIDNLSRKFLTMLSVIFGGLTSPNKRVDYCANYVLVRFHFAVQKARVLHSVDIQDKIICQARVDINHTNDFGIKYIDNHAASESNSRILAKDHLQYS